MRVFKKNYIHKEVEHNLHSFTYKGGTSAYSYTYFWSPFNDFLLKFVPMHWAPNAITLAGFLSIIIAEIAVYGFGKLGDPIGSLRLLIFAVCVFAYQILDNLDGKQARRTKTASPLGMLFDHGCDAMVTFFLANCMSRILGITNEPLLLMSTFGTAMLSFYFFVWAQYHSGGVMHLGRVNAVDDGLPMLWVFALLVIYIGEDTLRKPSFVGLQYNQIIFYLSFIGGALEVWALWRNTRHQFKTQIREAVTQLRHLLYIGLTLAGIILFTDWWREDRFFNAILFCLGFVCARNITYMQLCVTTGQRYNQYTTSTKVFCVGFSAYILLCRTISIHKVLPENIFIYGMLVILACNYINFVVNVIQRMSAILGIKPFSIADQLQKQRFLAMQRKNEEMDNKEKKVRVTAKQIARTAKI